MDYLFNLFEGETHIARHLLHQRSAHLHRRGPGEHNTPILSTNYWWASTLKGLLPTFLFLQFSQNELQSREKAGLDWHGEVEEAKNQPIVLILPGPLRIIQWPRHLISRRKNSHPKDIISGLTGSSQSEYVKTFVTVAKTEVTPW